MYGLWDRIWPENDYYDGFTPGTHCLNIMHAEAALQNMEIAKCTETYYDSGYARHALSHTSGAISSINSKLTHQNIVLSDSAGNGLYVSETHSGGPPSSTIIKQCEFTNIRGAHGPEVELNRRPS